MVTQMRISEALEYLRKKLFVFKGFTSVKLFFYEAQNRRSAFAMVDFIRFC